MPALLDVDHPTGWLPPHAMFAAPQPQATPAPAAPPRLLWLVDARAAPWAQLIGEAAPPGQGCSAVVALACEGERGRSRREHLQTLTRAYDALADGSGAPVWLIASGYGAYLGTLLSQRRTIERMLLCAPAVYADAGWDLPWMVLDAAHAAHPSQAERAANDNMAFVAAGQYLGQVSVLVSPLADDDPPQAEDRHGLQVDYFYAFDRARERHLELPQRAAASAAEALRQQVARWLWARPAQA
ncbi:hypothetical protein PGB34_02240 [Xenophilus arseniciresistens]|uniref:Alpha/beta hydrolase n=1 Tax=Xenophilus arseniciresistens TaxID=1283306 RepID=A0AAE3SXP7_9BURK|nr:hypothetical protein [Xenophilus arseniciresistens]MDA7415174.1 hypothetical protein [Xenophilus arseniciresistens]